MSLAKTAVYWLLAEKARSSACPASIDAGLMEERIRHIVHDEVASCLCVSVNVATSRPSPTPDTLGRMDEEETAWHRAQSDELDAVMVGGTIAEECFFKH